jgi:aspartate/glutamate racemase
MSISGSRDSFTSCAAQMCGVMATIDVLREMAHTLMTREGAEAVLLAGTDLSTVMNEENAGFPTLDCAGVHIAAITKRLTA